MKPITRRRFLNNSLVAGAMLSMPFSRVLGANNDIRVAVVGIRGKGSSHIQMFSNLPGVRVVAICDVDSEALDREKKKLADRKINVDTYSDYRKLLEDKNIDAVVTATPNHWHALVTVWACQAGKDVYVEKPVSHNILEGRRMLEASRTYNCIVQSGTQRRSDEGFPEAIKHIHDGNLGKIKLIRGLIYIRRGSIGKVDGPQPIPPTIDYNLWCGPAPMEPLMRKKLHYDWHWIWSTGNGDFGNNGIHYLDLCRLALGENRLPPRVISIGGRFGYVDDGRTPNTQIVLLDYQPVPIIFEVRGLPRAEGDPAMDSYKGLRGGLIVHCENGYLTWSDGGWTYDNDGKKIKQFKGTGGRGHHENFIKAVRSRNISDLKADIREGHLSAALCHMGNISHIVGKEVSSDQVLEVVKSDKVLAETFDRFEQHLLANKVNFKATPRILGPMLTMDPATERFTGDFADSANKLLTREYRKPFVVPEQV
ncbi:MAG: Gfo/Idh/MocA family oxidoreductase [Kiritimatiellae bacterium]|nr:Gfo/Idh/MocA family oxidoreductase [Kiritimatiellia bacterium]